MGARTTTPSSSRWRPRDGPCCSRASPSRSGCSRWSSCPRRGCARVGYGGMLIPLVSIVVLAHAAARAARRRRAARGLASHPARRTCEPRLDGRGRAVIVRHRTARGGARGRDAGRRSSCPVFKLTTGETYASALAAHGPGPRRLRTARRRRRPERRAHADRGARRQGAGRGRHSAGSPGARHRRTRCSPPALDSNRDGTSVIVGIPREETVNASSLDVVRAVRTRTRRQRRGVVGVAGVGAIELDYEARRLRQLPADVHRDRAAHDRRCSRGRSARSCSPSRRSLLQPRLDGRRVRPDDVVLAGGPRLAPASSAFPRRARSPSGCR